MDSTPKENFFFLLFKADVNKKIHQTIRKKFSSTLTRCCEIFGKSKFAHFAVVNRESKGFFQSADDFFFQKMNSGPIPILQNIPGYPAPLRAQV